MLSLIALLTGSLLGCSACDNGKGINNTTVATLDVSKFVGQWYEIARFDHSFERGMSHTQAHYYPNEKGTIRVVNSGYKKGKLKESIGKAYRPDPEKQPGLLKVSFFGPFYSEYRVLWIDPDYNYLLVGSKSSKYLWIMSREKTIPAEILDKIIAFAQCRGYDTGKLIWVDQEITLKPSGY